MPSAATFMCRTTTVPKPDSTYPSLATFIAPTLWLLPRYQVSLFLAVASDPALPRFRMLRPYPTGSPRPESGPHCTLNHSAETTTNPFRPASSPPLATAPPLTDGLLPFRHCCTCCLSLCLLSNFSTHSHIIV
jgi:hypothetical protein